MTRSMLASHPDYEEINNLNQMRCWLLNPVLANLSLDIAEIDRNCVLVMLDDEINARLECGVFADWIRDNLDF